VALKGAAPEEAAPAQGHAGRLVLASCSGNLLPDPDVGKRSAGRQPLDTGFHAWVHI